MRKPVSNEDVRFRYGKDYEGGRLRDERCWEDGFIGAAHIRKYRREDGVHFY